MKSGNKHTAATLLIVYLLLLGWLLFFYQDQSYSRLSSKAWEAPNFELFKSIRHYFFVIFQTSHGLPIKSGAAVNLFGNVLLFVPVGFLIPLVLRIQNSIKFAFTAILCICVAELLQWICKVGIFDVDDVVLNTLGTMLGFWLLLSFSRPLSLKKEAGQGDK